MRYGHFACFDIVNIVNMWEINDTCMDSGLVVRLLACLDMDGSGCF